MINYGGPAQKENIVLKDDKASANEIWKEPPEIEFPQQLLEKLDLIELLSDL